MTENATSQTPTPTEAKTNKKGLMRERPIFFYDLETTGLNPGIHEIIEIGAVLVSQPDFQVIKTYEAKVIPEHIETASPEALKINHYDPENWRDAIPLAQAMREISEMAQDSIPAGYNVTFDWAFIQAALNQVGMPDPFYYHRVDVMSIAFAKLYNDQTFAKYSLSELCGFYGITNRMAHTALADAQATYEVFVAMMKEKFIEKQDE
jgi:DNA polymerase III epsilon subunit family exonuclease